MSIGTVSSRKEIFLEPEREITTSDLNGVERI